MYSIRLKITFSIIIQLHSTPKASTYYNNFTWSDNCKRPTVTVSYTPSLLHQMQGWKLEENVRMSEKNTAWRRINVKTTNWKKGERVEEKI